MSIAEAVELRSHPTSEGVGFGEFPTSFKVHNTLVIRVIKHYSRELFHYYFTASRDSFRDTTASFE